MDPELEKRIAFHRKGRDLCVKTFLGGVGGYGFSWFFRFPLSLRIRITSLGLIALTYPWFVVHQSAIDTYSRWIYDNQDE